MSERSILSESNELSSELLTALEDIATVVFPNKIDFSQVRAHLTGYNKEKAIEQFLEMCKKDPSMTKLKLHLVYAKLKVLADNGGLL